MLAAREKQILRTKLEKYEGKVNHMYKDSKGYITVGVGHLINSVADAQKLAFKTAKNLPASSTEIKMDYEAVKKQPANRLASFYEKHTNERNKYVKDLLAKAAKAAQSGQQKRKP